ncbi:metabolite traffic protein EboE [Granulosicoccaceae sp. 1_MG-2023]|nr:metabolite traffic protein EboE [Granulosicoccaceae sp. 1_MG-2023]
MGWKATELSYCTNVHPGESLSEINGNIEQFAGPVRHCAALNSMNAGLWISHQASRELMQADASGSLHKTLQAQQLQVNSLNGFPYGNFHNKQVKEAVYSPDWADRKRLDYTLSLATILAGCLDEGVAEGTISTLPLGFRKNWSALRHQDALLNLLDLVEGLGRLEEKTGRHIRVCLEMEPGCVLEHTRQVVALFSRDLPKLAEEEGLDTALINRYLGVCFDVCHQAVMFERVGASLADLKRAGIAIGKIQLSSALSLAIHQPSDIEQLLPFNEPRYLHQTSIRGMDGQVRYFNDLSEALERMPPQSGQEWRVHYHVPLQLSVINERGLQTTRAVNEQVLSFLAENPQIRPHLEIETYTWEVLPESVRPVDKQSLVEGIEAEVRYVRQRMQHYGLLEA